MDVHMQMAKQEHLATHGLLYLTSHSPMHAEHPSDFVFHFLSLTAC